MQGKEKLERLPRILIEDQHQRTRRICPRSCVADVTSWDTMQEIALKRTKREKGSIVLIWWMMVILLHTRRRRHHMKNLSFKVLSLMGVVFG